MPGPDDHHRLSVRPLPTSFEHLLFLLCVLLLALFPLFVSRLEMLSAGILLLLLFPISTLLESHECNIVLSMVPLRQLPVTFDRTVTTV